MESWWKGQSMWDPGSRRQNCEVKRQSMVCIHQMWKVKVKQAPNVMMQAGRIPHQKCAFFILHLSSWFAHILSLIHFFKASKVHLMGWAKKIWWAITFGEPTYLHFIGPLPYILRLTQKVLTGGAHFLQKPTCHRFGFCMHGLEISYFLSFLFHLLFF